MTGAEKFSYVLQGIAFGAGYFANLPVAETLSQIERYRSPLLRTRRSP